MNMKRLFDEMGSPPPPFASRMDAGAAWEAGMRARARRAWSWAASGVVVLAVGVASVVHAVSGEPQPPSASPSAAVPSPTPTLACATATAEVKAALSRHGFPGGVQVSCVADRLIATVELVASPIRVVLTIRITAHRPAEAAAMACSGRPGVCEQSGSVKLARQDGLLIEVGVSAGSSGQLSSLVLDLDARLTR